MNTTFIKQLLFLSFFSLSSFASSEEESINQVNLQAQALWEAQDYGGAESLYQHLFSQSLPSWQKARIHYNLGTIQLARNQPDKAIKKLQEIAPADLSLPRFGRDLFLNLGISYMQYAQTLTPDSPDHVLQTIYLQQSLMALNEAQTMSCHLRGSEEKVEGLPCSPQKLIRQWTQTALHQLDVVQTQKVQQWMKQTSIEFLSTFLSIQLEQLIAEAKNLQEKQSTKPWSSYFQQQTESLAPLWNALKDKKISPGQLPAFNSAASAFLNASKAFDKNNLTTAIESLSSASEKLSPLHFKENIPLQLTFLNYHVLLLQPTLSLSDLETVIWEVNQIKEKEDQTERLNGIRHYLQNGEEALKGRDPLKVRFFLLAGFGLLDSLLPANPLTSIGCLQKALDQASRSLELLQLSQLMPQESIQNELNKILLQQQQAVLTQSSLFIPAALEEQSSLFGNGSQPDLGCQQSPWDRAIPLFDHGYIAAQSGEKLLAGASFNSETVAAQQQQTIQDWHQALGLLKNPPRPSPTAGSSTAPKNLAETFRLIQEMYLEDQSQPEPESRELHSW